MRPKSSQTNNLILFVNPYQKEVILELSGLFEFPHTTKKLHIS